MRVLFDTNLFITYLLAKDKKGKVQAIIEAVLARKVTLLLPQELIKEIQRKITIKKYLINHIPTQAAKDFIILLTEIGEKISQINAALPKISRDKKDDYLLAYAIAGKADYLVSGDTDLLILKHIGKVTIVSPAEFYEIIYG